MVKHIVLFKLKDEAPADKKLTAMKEFKAAIEALPAKISVGALPSTANLIRWTT